VLGRTGPRTAKRAKIPGKLRDVQDCQQKLSSAFDLLLILSLFSRDLQDCQQRLSSAFDLLLMFSNPKPNPNPNPNPTP